MNWAEAYMHVATYTVSNGYAYLKPAEPERTIVFSRASPPKASEQTYHFENAYEFLDEEGEWFLNTNTQEVFYKLRSGENITNATVMAPNVRTLVEIRDATNLQFYGLLFEYSNWTRPNLYGHLNWQAEQYSILRNDGLVWHEHPPAAVKILHSKNIRFERNNFQFMGSTALDLGQGTSDSAIVGNIFRDSSGNGISIGHFEESFDNDVTLTSKRNIIKNNFLYQLGQDYFGSVAIVAGYVQSTTIDHNEIYNMPYTGISVGWGWTLEDTVLQGNQIRYNHIYNTMTKMTDGAGIYLLSKQPGTRISNNFVHDQLQLPITRKGPNAGIYLDEGSSGITVENNFLCNVPTLIFDHSLGGTNTFVNNAYRNRLAEMNTGLEAPYYDISFWHSLQANANREPVLQVSMEGLQHWLRADAGVLTDANNAVNVWVDYSGKDNHALQGVGDFKPEWLNNTSNGNPALRFDGTDDNLNICNTIGLSKTFTVFFVINPTNLKLKNQSIGASGGWNEFQFQSSSKGEVFVGITTTARIGPDDGLGPNTVISNTWQQFAFEFNHGNASFYKDGRLLSSKILSIPVAWTGFSIGRNMTDTIDGYVSEVLVYDRALTDKEKHCIEAYLSNKYTLPNPPYQCLQNIYLPIILH